MSGWERPTPPPPDESPSRSSWAQPADADPLSPGQLIRRGWRLYRSVARRILAVAAPPEAVRIVLFLPSLALFGSAIQGAIEVFVEFVRRVAADPELYRGADSALLQAQLQGDFQAKLQALIVPSPETGVWLAVSAGAGGAAGLIGTSALVAAALSATANRPISIAESFRLVVRRGGLIWPIIVLGLGWIVVTWLPLLLQGSSDFQTWAGAPGSPRANLLASLLALLALVLTIGIVVVAVRWALYIPAVLAEDLGVGRGLPRAAVLSRGIRIRLGLAMIGVLLLHAISVGLVATTIGLIVGIATLSVPAGLAAFVVASFAGDLLWAPLLPAILAVAYRDRLGAGDSGSIEEPGR